MAHLIGDAPQPPVAAPAGDVIEFDELGLRQSPPLWMWVCVSRLTRRVLGAALGGRTDEFMTLCKFLDVGP